MNIHKVITIGDSNVGKTSFISRFCKPDEPFLSAQPTFGVDFESVIFTSKNASHKLQIWDTAGQERYRSINQTYCRRIDIALIFFDLSNLASFTSLDSWCEFVNDSATSSPKIIFIGTKSDKVSREIITIPMINKIVEANNAAYFPTCSLRNKGIQEVIDFIVTYLDNKIGIVEDFNIVSLKPKNKKITCC